MGIIPTFFPVMFSRVVSMLHREQRQWLVFLSVNDSIVEEHLDDLSDEFIRLDLSGRIGDSANTAT
jgi:hypothetical protein